MVAHFLPASQLGLPKRLFIALTAKQVTQPSAFHEGLVSWLHKTGHAWRDVSTLDAVSYRIFSLGLLAYCLGFDLELPFVLEDSQEAVILPVLQVLFLEDLCQPLFGVFHKHTSG